MSEIEVNQEKEKTRYRICGGLLIFMTLLSVYPLVLIKSISGVAYGYAVVSWAMMFFIGMFLSIWVVKMNKINEEE